MVSKCSPPVARRERRALPRNQRGAPGNPPGRFEVLHIEPESDETCAPDDPASVRGVPTLYFRDTSRSIISSNTQSDDRPRPTSVVSHRQVRILSVGIVRASDDSCNNAAPSVLSQWFADHTNTGRLCSAGSRWVPVPRRHRSYAALRLPHPHRRRSGCGARPWRRDRRMHDASAGCVERTVRCSPGSHRRFSSRRTACRRHCWCRGTPRWRPPTAARSDASHGGAASSSVPRTSVPPS